MMNFETLKKYLGLVLVLGTVAVAGKLHAMETETAPSTAVDTPAPMPDAPAITETPATESAPVDVPPVTEEVIDVPEESAPVDVPVTGEAGAVVTETPAATDTSVAP